jgi:hypothetical protein
VIADAVSVTWTAAAAVVSVPMQVGVAEYAVEKLHVAVPVDPVLHSPDVTLSVTAPSAFGKVHARSVVASVTMWAFWVPSR